VLTWTWAFLIFEWLIRLVMLVYVPQKRAPAAARTWLLMIFIEPTAGLILYTIFGRAYLPRKRVEMHERGSSLIRNEAKMWRQTAYQAKLGIQSEFLPAIKLAEHLGDFGIVGGNRVELLPGYERPIDRLIADIDGARHHAHLLYYIFADDTTGQRVADALIRAVKRGVQCRLLMDGIGSKRAIRTLAPRLRAQGIEVTELLPVGLFRRKGARYDLRNHRKIVVIDGQIGYVGSQNIVNADFKAGITYEELVARVTGPVVAQLQAVFLVDRYVETEIGTRRGDFFPDPAITGATPAQVLPSGPSYPHENNQRLIVALIHAAQKRVVITTPYFIPDVSLLEALDSACLRGVDVRLVMSHQADQILVGLAQRSFYEELLEFGVKIHLYKKRFLHAKHMSIDDDVALIGSSNMDIRSFVLNAEISMIVYDPAVVAKLRAIQEKAIAAADLLTYEEWCKRPFPVKVLQNTARLVDSVL
jgi:cardiolipin synthase